MFPKLYPNIQSECFYPSGFEKWLLALTQYFSVVDRYTLVDILRAILLSLEAMIEDPELQVNGFVLIIDWSNFTFKQASKLTPSMLRLAIEGLQVRIC